MSNTKKSFGQIFVDMFIPQKGDTKQKRISKIVSIVAVLVLIIALVIGGLVIRKYAKGRADLDDANNLYSKDTASDTSEDETSDESTTSEEPTEPPVELDPELGINVDFVELYKKNPDVIGHISIPGTLLEMPVLQTPISDEAYSRWSSGDFAPEVMQEVVNQNTYYLDHNIDKEYAPFGIPFADSRAKFAPGFQSTVVTMYGHAARDGSYFAPVKKYKDLDFYKEHPTIEFNTLYSNGTYKIIGMFLEDVDWGTNPDMFNYHDWVNLSEEHFNQYVANVRERSFFTTDVDAKYGDNLIALSTCSKNSATSIRAVLVARKVRPGESTEVDVSKAAVNENQKTPATWDGKLS